MERVSIDDLENTALESATVTKRLTDPLGISDMALNYYEVEPDDAFTGALHTHMNQEEIFYVLEGVATFETVDAAHEVKDGEAIRFAPGEYQAGRNDGDDVVRALAFGAPQDPGEGRVRQPCRECGDAEYHVVHVDPEEGGITLECPECGNDLK